jgi:hypothetical protein
LNFNDNNKKGVVKMFTTVCYVIAGIRFYDQLVMNEYNESIYLWKIQARKWSLERYKQLNDLIPVAVRKIDVEEAKRLLNKKEYYNKRVLIGKKIEGLEDFITEGFIDREYDYDLYILKLRSELY